MFFDRWCTLLQYWNDTVLPPNSTSDEIGCGIAKGKNFKIKVPCTNTPLGKSADQVFSLQSSQGSNSSSTLLLWDASYTLAYSLVQFSSFITELNIQFKLCSSTWMISARGGSIQEQSINARITFLAPFSSQGAFFPMVWVGMIRYEYSNVCVCVHEEGSVCWKQRRGECESGFGPQQLLPDKLYIIPSCIRELAYAIGLTSGWGWGEGSRKSTHRLHLSQKYTAN